MKSFKEAAAIIIKQAGKPLHVSRILLLAQRRGLLQSHGKTPVATMAAQLAVDVKRNGAKSRFMRVEPSTYKLNPKHKEPEKAQAAISTKHLSEDFVKHAVIQWLSANGWGYFKYDALHTHGVDIRARHHGFARYFYIEAKGTGKIRQANESYFISALGQIVTRMTATGSTRTYYGLGFPAVIATIAMRRIPWQVAKKLLLHVFAVSDDGTVVQYSPRDFKRLQKHKAANFAKRRG